MKTTDPPICVVDDDAGVREALEGLLRAEGFEVELFGTAQRFMNRAAGAPLSCVILDVELPGLSGLDLQRELAEAGIAIPIIFLTGHGSIPMSVKAMKAGAVEFLTKPFDEGDLLNAIQQAVSGAHSEELETANGSTDIVGESRVLKAILNRIKVVAPTDSTVLILGETGTGKELIAKEIHRRSRRADKPMIRVNCASIPKELYESEFFGHVKGAFTGAFKDRVGRFEAANGGTLFLDEVGEIPLDLQSKLLRALQEKQYERVGEDKTKRVDFRIIAATNRSLKAEVAAGRFREDLYYRLNVFPLEVPALRERRDDIPHLASHFVDMAAKETKCPKARLTPAGVAALQNYDWPGNIRELRNVIERAVILAHGGALEFDLPMVVHHPQTATTITDLVSKRPEPEFLTEPELQRRERENLLTVLGKTGWKIKGADGAAELLGVKPTTLISRVKKMGLRRDATATFEQFGHSSQDAAYDVTIAARTESARIQSVRVAVMVCDVRDFSTMSELLPEEEIARTLGQWFRDVGNVVHEAGGTIDKFVGDGALAYWTRESEDGRESRGALDSALSLLKTADKRRWRLPEEKPFAIAVALHHGMVTCGNVGLVAQRDATIIGDTVNTVFRIEDVMKRLNQRLALSQDFLSSLPSPGIDLNDLGEHQLKGKYQAVRLFGMA
jgi:DNA-binding NtrC family response regulator/class 3 adenylate cyclase